MQRINKEVECITVSVIPLFFFIKQAQFYENIILSSLFSQNISEGTVYSKRDF